MHLWGRRASCRVPSCVYTTEHSLGSWLHSHGSLPNLRNRKEGRAVVLLNTCTFIASADTCVALCAFAAIRDLKTRMADVLNAGFLSSVCCIRIFSLLRTSQICPFTYLPDSSDWWRHKPTWKAVHTAKVSASWHVLNYSWVQIRLHEIVMIGVCIRWEVALIDRFCNKFQEQGAFQSWF